MIWLIMTNYRQMFREYLWASKEKQEKRWDICKKCPELKPSNRCKKCGCFMKVKTKLNLASCPINKW